MLKRLALTMIGTAGLLVVASASQGVAGETSALLDGTSWRTFANGPTASLAWAGIDESLAVKVAIGGAPRQAAVLNKGDENIDLLRAVAAPEPPALVLAGLALGGVLCSRTVAGRRKQAAGDHDTQA